MPNQNFKKSYSESLQALGLDELIYQGSIDARGKGVALQVEPNTTHYATVLLNNKELVAEAIQAYMAKTPYKQGENLIIDALIANKTLPVWYEDFTLAHLNPFTERRILGQDISKPLNHAESLKTERVQGFGNQVKTFFGFNSMKQGILDNFETVEGVLHKLNQLAQYEDQAEVANIMNKGMGAKALALGASLVISYAILGVVSPKLQSWVASQFSGETLPDRLKHTVDTEAIKNEIVAEAIKKQLQADNLKSSISSSMPSLMMKKESSSLFSTQA
jgi:hypothetical protein